MTSAELAGVEKADALLVSQKVGYEDVWDLRNVGDALESGTSSELKVIGTYDNNNYFTMISNITKSTRMVYTFMIQGIKIRQFLKMIILEL